MSDALAVNEQAFAKLTVAQQREIREALNLVRSQLEQNPLAAYLPYEKQARFHSAPERTRMFVGGNRCGKSTCGAADDLLQAMPREFVPDHLKAYKRYGWDEPFKGRVITPDLGHTMQVILDKFFELAPRQTLKGGSWDTAFDKTKRILRFARGDVIDFMSFEQGKDKFGGVDLHRIHYDEEPSGLDSWAIHRDSRMRLIDHGGDMIFTMTPLAQTDWVQDKFWDKRGTEGIFGIQAAMRDNPHISEKEIDLALSGLTRDERLAIEFGNFVAFGGMFYDMFGDQHVRPAPTRADVAQYQAVVVGIDPGQTTGVVWLGFDNDETILVFDEFYPKGQYPDEIAAEIKRRNEAWGVAPTYVIDPAARIKAGPNQEQFTTAYARAGVFCDEGQNARGPGITEVQRRLEHNRLFVSEDCKNLRWEFTRYRRDPNSQDEWAAIKKNDHLLDALRYAVMSRTWSIPKGFATKRSNFNDDPMFEPPWRGPVPTDNPPLGAFS